MAEQNSQIENITNIDSHLDYQAVIIGAGVAGIYQIKRLADLGVRALVLDANADLGGTWYNNRYPGRDLILRAIPTAIHFQRKCSTSGIGLRSFHPSPRRCST